MRVIAGFPKVEVIIHVRQTSMKTFGDYSLATFFVYIGRKIIAGSVGFKFISPLIMYSSWDKKKKIIFLILV